MQKGPRGEEKRAGSQNVWPPQLKEEKERGKEKREVMRRAGGGFADKGNEK